MQLTTDYDKKFFMLTLNKVSVNRTFAVSIKDAYNSTYNHW